ncbi:MAG: chorismate-binding protein, partial [Leptospiraceae bacterium]|nr:chorismate-binding protein [Leptospiraceae bacterium]
MKNQNYFQFQKKISFKLIQELYDSKSKFLWMDSNLKKSQILSYLFYHPIEWIVCKEKESLYAKLSELDYALKNGYWLAGFFSYEIGEILQGFSVENRDFPYFQFAVYEKPLVFCELEEIEKDFSFQLSNIKISISEEEYIKNILTIKELIESGKVYQINYTFFLEFDFSGSYLDFYLALRKQQKTDYSAFVFYDLPILSLSPELFFKIQKTKIQTKPMKGTFT